MNIDKGRTTLIIMVAVLGVATAIWTFSPASKAAASPPPHVFTTGMFGVARSQTARTNVLNLGGVNALVECLYLNDMGNVVSRSGRQEVSPGQSKWFDIPVEQVFPTETIRVELRAVVMVIDANSRGLNFTAEVFDNDTSKASIFMAFDAFDECACGAL